MQELNVVRAGSADLEQEWGTLSEGVFNVPFFFFTYHVLRFVA